MSDKVLNGPVHIPRVRGTPAHALIERWFTEAIFSGKLRPGDKLPREQDLAATFGVSRMTLRQALAGLQNRGVLDRIPGRSGGTFVCEPRIDCDLTGLVGFTEQLRRAQLRAGARVVETRTTAAGHDVAVALNIGDSDAVHEVVRVRSALRTPLAIERSYFPAAVFGDLLAQRLTGSLYRLMSTRYDQQPRTGTEFLSPVSADADEARLLEVSTGTALMLVERTAFTASGLPVEFARDLFRPDRVRISVRSGWQEPDSI
ncbi:MAG TPA: GntR family transcriptional regulator [Jatrophihabitans sp.]